LHNRCFVKELSAERPRLMPDRLPRRGHA
jgi:hypothetical protein